MARVAAILLILGLLFPLTPVFDCTNPVIRQEYPAQCPQLPDPLLTGGGGGHGGGGDSGILGTIGKILGGLTGGLL